jgi:tRNA(adenine34) deaminase
MPSLDGARSSAENRVAANQAGPGRPKGATMAADHERFMRLCLEEAARGGAEGNIAVGSLVARDGEVVAAGRNLVTSALDPTAHAEVVALRETGRAARAVDFSGWTLYTTFEPCPMCCGAIIASGIGTLVLGARHDPATSRWGPYTVERLLDLAGWTGRLRLVTGVLTAECLAVRREWDARNAHRRPGP